MKTIGLIGGTGWVSTVEYYRQLNEKINQRLGDLNFASCILHSFNYGEIDILNRSNDQEGLHKKLHLAAQSLILSGAEGIALCANALHMFAEQLGNELNVPIIHIAEATATKASLMGLKKIGLGLATEKKTNLAHIFFRRKTATTPQPSAQKKWPTQLSQK